MPHTLAAAVRSDVAVVPLLFHRRPDISPALSGDQAHSLSPIMLTTRRTRASPAVPIVAVVRDDQRGPSTLTDSRSGVAQAARPLCTFGRLQMRHRQRGVSHVRDPRMGDSDSDSDISESLSESL